MLTGSETSKGIGIGVARVLGLTEISEMVSAGSVDAFFSSLKPGTVLVANHLTPYMVAKLKACGVAGFVCETGGMTSHSALVARSIGLPAVYGVPGAAKAIQNGDTVIVDGLSGYVYERPDPELALEFASRKEKYIESRKELEKFCSMKTKMADSENAEVFCNVNDIVDVMHSLDNGGEGIGLYRTENLYAEAGHAPGEEEQVRAYSRIAQAMDGREVVIRTLDIGGDKSLPYLDMELESNPFLGYRAVRYSLGNRRFFATQLRAILRASALGNISIMIPMITCVDEMREVKALVYELKSDLRDEGYDYDDNIKVGCMIETPSAAIISDMLALESDFFSVGTNDLVQYTMSADRGNRNVAYLQSVTQPAVLRLIKQTIDNAKNAGVPVSVCGEAAADPALIPILAGMGCRRFSVNPGAVPEVRRTLSLWSVSDAEKYVSDILKMPSDNEIKEFMRRSARI